MITEVIMTQLGETMNEGTIASWHKQVGDKVAKGDPLVSVETDKAVLEIESPRSGYLVQIVEPAGAAVPVLKVIGYLADQADETMGASAPSAAAPVADAGTASATSVTAEPVTEEAGPPVKISPVARKLAKDQGVDITMLKGTGPGGRIIERDILEFVQQRQEEAKAAPVATAPVAAPPVAAPVPVEAAASPVEGDWDLIRLTRMRKIIAEKLSQSYREAVHVTLHCEVDMTAAGDLRGQLSKEWEAKHGVKVTFTDVVVKAVAQALTEHRAVNASFAGDSIRQHRRVNVGVAMSISTGLVVPVLKDTDKLGLLEIARALRATTNKARSGQIAPDDLVGGTFTVSNMGMMGIDTFTPIINGAEGAILGVGQITEKPVAWGGAVAVRPRMPLSLSFDHRIVDGAGAAVFLKRVKEILENPYLLFA